MAINMLHTFAGISGAVGVGFGAIGAHALKNKLNTYREYSRISLQVREATHIDRMMSTSPSMH